MTCKPDFKDEPCIAFYSLSCIAINNRPREKVPDDKFGDMYISHVRSEHCDWSTENMRQLDLCSFNLSDPIQFCMQALQNVTFSNFLHFSQFKTPKQVKSLVKIKWLKKYTILRRFCFFKRNVYQPVEFMNILMLKQQSILRLTSTKFPEMEIFLRNVWKMCV